MQPPHQEASKLGGRSEPTTDCSTRRDSLRCDSRWPPLPLSALRQGKLFSGFLTLRPRCEVCGLDYALPIPVTARPYSFMFLAGFIVVGAALVTEVLYRPPYWVHAALASPDPSCRTGAVAAAEGNDDCAAALPQGRREALRRAVSAGR